MKKLLATLLVVAMVLCSIGTVVFATSTTVTSQSELEDAISNAADGDTIILAAGEYDLPVFSGKELTFKGENKNSVIVNDAPDAKQQGWIGSSFHFENLTANGVTENYHGLANGVVSVTYKDCKINYLRFLYAATVSFENCAFDSMGAEHSFWTYGASNVTVTDCTFKYADRAVNCYKDPTPDHETDITFTDCTFTYTGNAADHKGAVEINSSTVKSIDVNLDNCTGTNGEKVSFISEWDSTGGANTTVNARVIAKIGDVEYKSLTDAMNAVQAGETVTIMEGTYKVPTMKAGITVVGEGDVLLEGTLSGTLKDLTLKNIHIKGANAQRWAYASGNLVFENVTFEATSVYAIHFDGITAGTNLLYKDCTIIGWAAIGGSPASCVFDGCTIKDNGYYGVIRTYFDTEIKNCTFDVDGANPNDVYEDGIHAVDATVKVDECVNANGDMKDILNISDEAYIYINDELALAPEVKIGDNYYNTLQEAISDANDGDTIDLLGNVVEFNGSYNGIEGSRNLTFKNGTMDFTGARADDSVFFLWGEDLAFEKIKFVRNESDKFMCYLMNISSVDSVVSFTDCEFEFNDEIYSSYIANNAGGKITYINCKMSGTTGNNFSYGGGALFDNCVYNSETADIIAHNNFPSEIRNSQVVTNRIRIRNVSLTPGVTPTVKITGNSDVYAANGLWYTSTPAEGEENALIIVEQGSTLKAVGAATGIIDTVNSTGKIVATDSNLEVAFNLYENNPDAGYMIYDIVVKASDAKVINRLNTADLTFETNNPKVAYEITPADKIALTTDLAYPNRYMFNFKGKDDVVDTANEIVIGQVKFTGYGAFVFGVANETTNIVTATTIKDNIVDEFAGNNLITNTINTEIKVPTRTLTVNVTFPNTVKDNDATYQNMKVEITGNIDGVTQTIPYALGDAANAGNIAAYVVEEDRLVLNESYTVTVSGAGYRTARYTVTMTDNKTLNFWNNVKDNKVEIEEGKDSSAVELNFLAGDIVADNNINIYDLSAVVSYFTQQATVTNGYVKYDLNRDGKIDSKDVAYILVSWGK